MIASVWVVVKFVIGCVAFCVRYAGRNIKKIRKGIKEINEIVKIYITKRFASPPTILETPSSVQDRSSVKIAFCSLSSSIVCKKENVRSINPNRANGL